MKAATYKKRREALGITQVQMAKALGVTQATLSFRESGRNSIRKEMELALEALEYRAMIRLGLPSGVVKKKETTAKKKAPRTYSYSPPEPVKKKAAKKKTRK